MRKRQVYIYARVLNPRVRACRPRACLHAHRFLVLFRLFTNLCARVQERPVFESRAHTRVGFIEPLALGGGGVVVVVVVR